MMPSNVSSVVDAYRGREPELMQRYQNSQELIYLLALQKLKSEKEAAMRDIQMKMNPQGEPPTVAKQREDEVRDLSMKEFATQVTGAMQQRQAQAQEAQRNLLAQGLAAAPGANTAMTPKAMAAGGIVAFDGLTGSYVEGSTEPSGLAAEIAKRLRAGESYPNIRDSLLGPSPGAPRTTEGGRNPEYIAHERRAQEFGRALAEAQQILKGQPPAPSVAPTPVAVPPAAPINRTTESPDHAGAAVPRATAGVKPDAKDTSIEPDIAGGLKVPDLQESIQNRLTQGLVAPDRTGLAGLTTAAPSSGATLAAIQAELSRLPQGNERQQQLVAGLESAIKAATEHGAAYPGMTPENLRARQQAIEQMRGETAAEFDPKKQALAGLARFLLGGAGRTRGQEFAGAGAAGLNYLEQQAAAEKARRAQIRGEEEKLRAMQEAEAVAKYGAKGKSLETAIQGQGALSKLMTDMSEGDATRGNYLARTALELASRKDISDNELRTKLAIAAADLNVKLTEGQLDRVVKAAGVEAELLKAVVSRQDSAAQRRSEEISRLASTLAVQSREAADDFDKRKPIGLTTLVPGDPNLTEKQRTDLANWERKRRDYVAQATKPLRDRIAVLEGRPNYSLASEPAGSAADQGVRVTGVSPTR